MKFRTLATLAATSIVLVTANSAQACISGCDFSGVNVNLGNLNIGQSGTISEDLSLFEVFPPSSSIGLSLAYGALPTNSEVIFSYAFTGMQSNPNNTLTSSINYDYTYKGNAFKGGSNGNSLVVGGQFGNGVLSQGGSINGSSVGAAGISQVFATANLPNITSGQSTIASYAIGFQNFSTSLFAYFNTSPAGTATIQYRVIGLPLPASLPMMLLAIGGLFGYSRINKRKAFAA